MPGFLRMLITLEVKYSKNNNCSFIASSGGNGWADTFHLDTQGIVLNLRGIRKILFNTEKTQAMFQGGALVSEMVSTAYASNTRVSTATCNCVGHLGAIIGGGLSRTMGLYGLGIDQLLSANLVTSFGDSLHVNSHDPDLWWALRGGGANFGIITSATVKAYPVAAANNTAWTGPLTFASDKIEAVVQAINILDLKPEMEIDFYFATTGPPNYTPSVLAIPFYVGSAAAGRAAFASIFAAGPVTDGTTIVPYNQWNAAGDTFCIKGMRKPAYGVSMNRMDPATWRAIWNQYVGFLGANPRSGNSTIRAECYSIYKSQSYPRFSSSYPFRDVKCHGVVIPWYANSSLDTEANPFGSKVRDLWRSADNLAFNSS